MYSDLYLKPKSKPSVLLIIFAVISVFGFVISYVGIKVTTPIQASNKKLVSHEVVNLSAKQVGIFWETVASETGWIIFGINENDLTMIKADDRDVGTDKRQYRLHLATINGPNGTGLVPGKKYYYKIVTGNSLVSANNSHAFEFQTPMDTSVHTSLKPAYGKVVLSNDQPAQNVFVFYKYDDSTTLLTLTKGTGEWLIPLQNIYSSTNYKNIPVQENHAVKLIFRTDMSTTSTVITKVNKTNPLSQTIVLGKNYNLEENDVLPASTNKSQTIPSIQTLFNTSSNVESVFTVSLPKENAIIPGSSPLFRGAGEVGADVIMTINTTPGVSARSKVNSRGEWTVDIPFSIKSGTYKAIIKSKNKLGIEMSINRIFSIAKSGERVLGDSTGSATITLVPTIEPIVQDTIEPTVQPTTVVVASTSIPISTTAPTVAPTNPVSGFNGFIYVFGSILLVGIGLMSMYLL
ncbi:MAG: hypothetical protein WCO06_00460 [Candidatus Roizmanbacteria bacterium]